jgi:hypothetical protein
MSEEDTIRTRQQYVEHCTISFSTVCKYSLHTCVHRSCGTVKMSPVKFACFRVFSAQVVQFAYQVWKHSPGTGPGHSSQGSPSSSCSCDAAKTTTQTVAARRNIADVISAFRQKPVNSPTTQCAAMQNDEGKNIDLYIPRKWCVVFVLPRRFLGNAGVGGLPTRLVPAIFRGVVRFVFSSVLTGFRSH